MSYRRENNISALKSMRNVSYVEFLKAIKELQTEVFTWAKSQSPKTKELGIITLYRYVEEAFGFAFAANCRYPSTIYDFNFRATNLLKARENLHCFNAQLAVVNNVINISTKKLKRWCNASERAIRLINGVIKSDKAKAKSKNIN